MKRALLSLVLAMSLLLPSAAQPQTAAADSLCSEAYGAVIGFYTLGIACLASAGEFDEAKEFGPCAITEVSARVTLSEADGRTDIFAYRTADPCPDIQVNMSYAHKTQEVQERLRGGGRTVIATWTCDKNPMTQLGNGPLTCTRNRISSAGGPAVNWDADAAAMTSPMSVAAANNISRETLNGQLRNALKQAEDDQARAAAPKPAPKPQAPPQLAPALALSMGSPHTAHVTAAQYLLRWRGADIVVDGDYGQQTRDAVRAFQTRRNLTVTGEIDSGLWTMLGTTIVKGATESDVVNALQTLLTAHGHPVMVDGDFGGQTDTALRAFQTKHGLAANGSTDPRTWRVLAGAIAEARLSPSHVLGRLAAGLGVGE